MKVVLRLSRPKAAFAYPLPPAPRTAILVPWFQGGSHSSVRVFQGGWSAEAAAFQPAAIAATWLQMKTLLTQQIESLTHVLIVLARPKDPLLTMEQRQQLWRAFGVPIFEQIIGGNGALFAAECEAHAGLHIESRMLKVPDGSIESAACGCGRSTPRIKIVEQVRELHEVQPHKAPANP